MEEYIEKMMERSNSGESKMIFKNICTFIIGLTTSGRKDMARGGGIKKRQQYCTDSSGVTLYFPALHGHSGRSLIELQLYRTMSLFDRFLRVHLNHIGCAINLHSIMNSGLILGGQNLSKKTDSILHACGSYEQRTQRS